MKKVLLLSVLIFLAISQVVSQPPPLEANTAYIFGTHSWSDNEWMVFNAPPPAQPTLNTTPATSNNAVINGGAIITVTENTEIVDLSVIGILNINDGVTLKVTGNLTNTGVINLLGANSKLLVTGDLLNDAATVAIGEGNITTEGNVINSGIMGSTGDGGLGVGGDFNGTGGDQDNVNILFVNGDITNCGIACNFPPPVPISPFGVLSVFALVLILGVLKLKFF